MSLHRLLTGSSAAWLLLASACVGQTATQSKTLERTSTSELTQPPYTITRTHSSTNFESRKGWWSVTPFSAEDRDALADPKAPFGYSRTINRDDRFELNLFEDGAPDDMDEPGTVQLTFFWREVPEPPHLWETKLSDLTWARNDTATTASFHSSYGDHVDVRCAVAPGVPVERCRDLVSEVTLERHAPRKVDEP